MACLLDLHKLDCDVAASIPAIKEFMRNKASHHLSAGAIASVRIKNAKAISVTHFIKEFDTISNEEIVAKIKHMKLNAGVLTGTVCSDLGLLKRTGLLSLSDPHDYVPRIWWAGSGPTRFIRKLIAIDIILKTR